MLSVVLKVLHPVAANPLFAQPPKPVIAVAFVLIHQDAVVLDQAVELGPVEQVAGLVVLVVFDLRSLPIGARLLDGLQLLVEVVAVAVAS
ncbi:hypothetical protein D3C76_1417330 [compost metagenome]